MNEDKGLLNMLLNLLGLPGLRWLNSAETAMTSLVIVSWWKSVGYYTVIIFSALQTIPTEIYEAADLDNAGRFSRFFRITFPMISPQAFLCLITMTIGSFKVFETIRVMTGGGPGKATYVLVYYIYMTAFQGQFKVCLACAAGVVLLFIVGLLTALYFMLLSGKCITNRREQSVWKTEPFNRSRRCSGPRHRAPGAQLPAQDRTGGRFCLPFLWMISTSLKTCPESIAYPLPVLRQAPMGKLRHGMEQRRLPALRPKQHHGHLTSSPCRPCLGAGGLRLCPL